MDYVEDNGNYLEGQINPGDIITGTYTYDSTALDQSSDDIYGLYHFYDPPAGIFLTVGGFDFATASDVDCYVDIINNGPSFGHDSFRVSSQCNLPLSNGAMMVEWIGWQLNDNTGSALSSDALPTTAPILDQWQDNLLLLETPTAFEIRAHVTSAVPEPATIVLFAVGALLLTKRY